MTFSALSVAISLLALLNTVAAQIGPDPRWLNPDGSQGDFASAFTAGNTVILSWKALNNSVSDLWLTHWDSTTYPWHYQVATGIDISVPGNLQWYINVPAWTIANDGHFVLRFYPHNALYSVLQIPQNDSPGILLTGGVTQSSSSGTATATSTGGTSTSATGSTTATSQQSTVSTLTTVTSTNSNGQTVTATVTTSVPASSSVSGASQSTSSPPSSGLSTAAKAGIGVGVAAAVIALLLGACLFVYRRRSSGAGRRAHTPAPPEGQDDFTNGFEKNGSYPLKTGVFKPISPTVPGVVEADSSGSDMRLPMTRTHLSNASESAALMSSSASRSDQYSDTSEGRGGQRQQSHPPWATAEIRGNNRFPVEKAGTMVRPGVHELG